MSGRPAKYIDEFGDYDYDAAKNANIDNTKIKYAERKDEILAKRRQRYREINPHPYQSVMQKSITPIKQIITANFIMEIVD